MDSDRVLVMDAGAAVEFDHPNVLLERADSRLKRLVEQTGSSNAAFLKSIAQKSFDKKVN